MTNPQQRSAPNRKRIRLGPEASGPAPTCDITAFIGRFKNLVQREAWGQGVEGRIWQASFYGHFFRKDEDVNALVDYILNNPVRRGLMAGWEVYPFAGSLVFALDRMEGGTSPRATPERAEEWERE